MMKWIAPILSLGFATSLLAATAPRTFGEKITIKTVTPLKEVVAQFDRYKDLDVVTTGAVTKVCEKKGCWMTVKTDAEDVRVTFKDYAFFVPASLTGQTARLQGRLTRQEVSVADQKHLLEDAGASKEAIAAVKQPKTEFAFVASGVSVD